MPWTCPACHQAIGRNEDDTLPRVGQLYRCHVCRIDLLFDPIPKKFIVADRDLPPVK